MKTHTLKILFFIILVSLFWTCALLPYSDNEAAQKSAQIALGKQFFQDKRLSGNSTMACATCHNPTLAFTDGRSKSIGIEGDSTLHNAPTILNTKYYTSLNWANPDLTTFALQNVRPMFKTHPKELGLDRENIKQLDVFKNDDVYKKMYKKAFHKNIEQLDYEDIIKTLGIYQQQLISFNSPFDRYKKGNENAISESAKEGFYLFNSNRIGCANCHKLPLFTDADEQNKFHNIGLYNLNGRYPKGDEGLSEITKLDSNIGKFRTPTLRNIALTAPYMHDGSIATLEGVLDHYTRGGRNITTGKNIGDGRAHPNKSEFVHGFALDAQERIDIINFLHTLTDSTVFLK